MTEPMSEERLADLTVRAFNSSDSDYLHDVEELLAEIDRLRPLADEASTLLAEKETLQREMIAAREEIERFRRVLTTIRYVSDDIPPDEGSRLRLHDALMHTREITFDALRRYDT